MREREEAREVNFTDVYRLSKWVFRFEDMILISQILNGDVLGLPRVVGIYELVIKRNRRKEKDSD